MSEEQRLVGGVGSTKVPLFHLIPLEALEGLADRFEQGVERKGDKAWNALSANQECLVNKDFLLDRISHVIHHAMKLRDQLARGVQDGEESMYENAGAVAFGGALFLCAAKEYGVDWSLTKGRTYQTVGGDCTGTLIEFNGSGFPPDRPPQFFSKLRSDVVWLWDGTPLKVNMSLTDAEVEKFRVAYGADGRVV